MLDHFQKLRVGAKEVLAGVGAAVGFAVLQLAVDDLVHALLQQALVILFKQRIPMAAPQHLDHVPTGTAEDAFQFLHDLAVAPDRSVQALQVTVDDEHQVIQLFPARQ